MRALVLPGILAAIGISVLVGLGIWQLERKAWKEGLIDTLQQRASAPPVALPGPEGWRDVSQVADEFRRVRARVEFDHAREVTVYSMGSALRPDVSGPGYFVFTPARLPGGALVVVDRGFVPQDRRDPRTRAEGQVPGPVELVGALRWPEPAGWFTAAPDAAGRRWFIRDHLGMAQALGWGPVAPFYISQEAPRPPGGLPKPGRLSPELRNQHLQYALTWFSLAVVFAAIFTIAAYGRLHGKASSRREF